MSGEIISRHKSLELAQKAAKKFQTKDCSKNTFRPWRIELNGETVCKHGMFEATGYFDEGW